MPLRTGLELRGQIAPDVRDVMLANAVHLVTGA
jgi:hypothetical protein